MEGLLSTGPTPSSFMYFSTSNYLVLLFVAKHKENNSNQWQKDIKKGLLIFLFNIPNKCLIKRVIMKTC